MAQLPFTTTAFFQELPNVTDVLEIIDAMTTTIVANAAWTEPSSDRFKMPVDADGRFAEILFNRTAALTLEATMFDDQGRSFATPFLLTLVSGSTITLFYGAQYLYIVQYLNSQHMFITLLTLAPESEIAHTSYTCWGANNLSGGGAAGVNTDRWYQIGATGVVENTSGTIIFPGTRTGENPTLTQHISGALRAFPVYNVGNDPAAQKTIRGRFYNVLILHQDEVAPAAERVFPIGDGVSATFKALNIPVATDIAFLIRKG